MQIRALSSFQELISSFFGGQTSVQHLRALVRLDLVVATFVHRNYNPAGAVTGYPENKLEDVQLDIMANSVPSSHAENIGSQSC